MENKSQERYVRRCFDLARLGKSGTATNPPVGAVIVQGNRIIGEGYHQFFGGPHAEVHAIGNSENQDLSESEIFVSLEPCVHQGKTPPCTDLIISKNIKACSVSLQDINPIVRGKGLEKLKQAGIKVQEQILPGIGKHLLKTFLIQQHLKRPYITLKWAQSADGYISHLGEQTKISNALSDRLVHKWRSEHDAIMVGTNTILVDNPKLTNRLYYGKSPIRVCIDRSGRIPSDADIFSPPFRTILFAEKEHSSKLNVSTINLINNDLQSIFEVLLQMNIGTILVEGGKKLLDSLLDQGLWDECLVITSSTKLGSGVEAPKIQSMPVDNLQLGDDRIHWFIRNEGKNC